MLAFTEKKYVEVIPQAGEYVIGADIGGTNSNFGIFNVVKKKAELVLSVHFKSQEIKVFVSVVQDLLSYLEQQYGIVIKRAVIAAAGPVKNNKVKPTNLDIIIDCNEVLQKTDLTCAFLVNDFEVIGHGLSEIDPKDLVLVNQGKEIPKANKAILGAGTGLGKCFMIWNFERGRYQSSASEGGHADFAVQTQLELDLSLFIKEYECFTCNISWENVLSGYGIQRIYEFFVRKNGAHDGNEKPHPDEIFNARNKDKNSWDTFELYTKLYARCAKNLALDALALGGVYIAGGIAAKNLPLFELAAFKNEFINCGKQAKLLEEVPVYVITDYNVSLYGAVKYLLEEHICDNK